MSFCVIISGDDNKLGRMIHDQWKWHRHVNVQGSFTEESAPSEVQTIEDMLKNFFMSEFQPDNYNILVKSAKFKEKDFDDTEEWYMTEYEFREWYFTHSHKYTMAFYNFFMEDEGNFRKIAPQVVEKELYKLWKEDPVLFTDMVTEFEDEDVEEYTFC